MKKFLSLFLSLCLMTGPGIFASADEAVFAGGSGTAEDPYQIATGEQLAAFSTRLHELMK